MNLNLFEFNESDLNSNRMGLISARQQQALNQYAGGIRKSQWGSVWVIGFFLPFGLCLILGMYLSNESTRQALFSDPLNFIIILAVIPIVIFIIALGIFFANRRANKLENAELKRVEGIVKHDEEHSKYGATYYLIVDDVEFLFSENVNEIFPEGSHFRIYYCDATHFQLILSYEKLS
ncbi:MAG: hypothetical protein JNJ43_04435 [Anaerolineales bacterium]|nr:hypothetical protein [Anaerolineales bacterium]